MKKTLKTIVVLVLISGAWTLNNLNGKPFAAAAEPLVLKGHLDGVTSAYFSPDGKKVMTGSDDDTARIWDAGTGKELLKIKNMYYIRFSPDGKKVQGNEDNTIRIWDAGTGKELLKTQNFSNSVIPVCFSPDGKKLLITNDNLIWDAETGKKLLEINNIIEGRSNGQVHLVCFSPDGKKILGKGLRYVENSPINTLQTWDAETGKELLKIKIEEYGIEKYDAVCFSPDGKKILGYVGVRLNVGLFHTVRIWDAETGKELLKTEEYSGSATPVYFSPDGKKMLVCSTDYGRNSTTRICDAETGKELLKIEKAVPNTLCFSPDGKKLLGNTDDRTTRIWDTETGKELLKIERVYPACFSPDGKKILGCPDNTALILNAETGKELLKIEKVYPACFSPDGTKVLGVTGEGRERTTARIWDVE